MLTVTTNTLDANIAKAVCEALAFESPKKIGWDDSKKMGACYSTCMNANERLRSNVFSYTIATGNIPSEHPAHTDNDIFYDAVEFNDNYKRALIENASMKATHQLTRDGGDHERDNRKRGGSVHEMQDDGSNISPASVTAIGTSAAFSQPPPPPRKAPPPPTELPLRFLRAGKGDPIEGQRRYEETLKWRDEKKMNETLSDAHPHFELIKKYYPHFFHLRGRNNEPVYFEKPAQTNLKALRAGGVDINTLLRHLAMVTEFNWQYVENDDFARNIYVIDLEGIRITDFVGECVEFLKKASKFTGAHYPERAGFVMVINVPSWFKIIWNVVKPMVDEVTLKKIYILRGKHEIFNALLERVPIENIPPEYGGQSMPLGQAPEEKMLWGLMKHNNNRAQGCLQCNGTSVQPNCQFCSFCPARSY